MRQTDHSRPARRANSTVAVALWGCVAIAATLYLGVALARPELLAGLGAPTPVSAPQSNEGQRAMAEASENLKVLQDSVQQVQMEMAGLRSELSSQAARDTEISERVTALEAKPAKPAQQAAAKPAPATTKTAAAPAPAAHSVAPPDAADAVVAEAAKKSGVKLLNAPLGSEGAVVTGSVAPAGTQAPIEFGPAVVTPTGNPVGIQIATGPSVDALRLSWNLLNDRHGDALKNLEPRYTSATDANGETFELLAGPVKSAADAQKICKQLLAKAVPCKVSGFGGDAL